VAPDGIPPYFLRRKGWTVSTSTARDFELKEAAGLDRNLRARLPDFHLPLSQRISAPVVVGNWYCPFMFIKEGKLKDQMRISRYYEMTLEQRWEQIFASEYNSSEGNSVVVDAVVQRETVAVAGREAAPDKRNAVDGVMWFRSSGDVGGEASVGLSLEIVGGMKWEQERAILSIFYALHVWIQQNKDNGRRYWNYVQNIPKCRHSLCRINTSACINIVFRKQIMHSVFPMKAYNYMKIYQKQNYIQK